MLITSRYDIGDFVKVGPHDGRISRITISSTGIIYEFIGWHDGTPIAYFAYDWEITLLSKVEENGQV